MYMVLFFRLISASIFPRFSFDFAMISEIKLQITSANKKRFRNKGQLRIVLIVKNKFTLIKNNAIKI